MIFNEIKRILMKFNEAYNSNSLKTSPFVSIENNFIALIKKKIAVDRNFATQPINNKTKQKNFVSFHN